MQTRWKMVLALVGGVTALAFGCQRRAVFPGGGPPAGADLAVRYPDAIAVDIMHDEGRSEGVLLPAAADLRNAPVVVFAHGNAELIDHWVERLRPYRRWGISIALLEYRGYGRSTGSASQSALVDDLTAFVEALARRPEVDPRRIIYHGRSLGGGVVCGVTRHHPPAALILESTFTSLSGLVWDNWYLPPFLVRDPFDSMAALARWQGPTLVMHGARDSLIPIAHGEALGARPGARFVSRSCGHNDCPRDAAYWQAIGALLRDAGLIPP